MAKASPRKLKVFQTRIGFYDVVIAAASKAAALRAWGTHHDLFGQGLASEASDAATVEAALAHPDTLLKRPAGSSHAYRIDPAAPTLADAGPPEPRLSVRKKPAPSAAEQRPPPPPPPKPAPDRGKLAAAEADLATLDREREAQASEHARRIEEIEAELKAIERRKSELLESRKSQDAALLRRRRSAEEAVARERRAYRSAGGED